MAVESLGAKSSGLNRFWIAKADWIPRDFDCPLVTADVDRYSLFAAAALIGIYERWVSSSLDVATEMNWHKVTRNSQPIFAISLLMCKPAAKVDATNFIRVSQGRQKLALELRNINCVASSTMTLTRNESSSRLTLLSEAYPASARSSIS